MKPILKFAAFILLIGIIIFVSCKKEYSCEGCRDVNRPPIANAGKDTTIVLPVDSVILDGSASTDDKKIVSYQWTKISGPDTFKIVQPTASRTTLNKLMKGVFEFELKVTDAEGLFSKDTVQVTVNAAISTNHPPIANAGKDTTIILPNNAATLDGSGSTDPDNNITSYAWAKISGPATFNITNANSVQTQVTNLIQGVYLFELKVTGAGGLFSKDTVQVAVSAAFSNPCDANRPQVNAQLIPIGTLSEPRAGMVVASAGNKILFAGGYSTGSVSTRVDIFDFGANTWSTAELSSHRRRIAAVAAGNKIFFAGGVDVDDYDWRSTKVDIYDVATDTWSLSNMSKEGDGLTTATTGNKVFFAGGNFGIYATSTVNIYDLTSNTWSTASLSAPRNFPAAVSANNKVYFTGGDPWTGQISNVIDIYDNITGVWSTSNLQVPRVQHASIAVNDILYFAGGFSTNSQPTCSVETLNTNTGARTLMNLSIPIAGLYAVVKDNKILFLRNDDLAGSDKFDVYDIISNTWSIGVLPYKIGGASIISVNNTTYVAGVSINGVVSNKVWKLEF